MKSALPSLFLLLLAARPAHADVTIVQKIEGLGNPSEMTIKIKGDKVRIDVSPQVTTIFDGKTGEMINLMKDQKTAVRISADKMRAAAEMIKKFGSQKESAKEPKLVSTGQKETINGYETEQYVYDGPDFKATYWITFNYPNGAAILRELQTVKTQTWDAANARLPDYGNFPGLPLRTRMVTKKSEANDRINEFTSTIISAKQDPLDESEFTVPKDFKELAMPNVLGGKRAAPSVSPGP
jgi:hypothetical protein